MNPRFERKSSMLLAEPIAEPVDIPDDIISSAKISTSLIIQMAKLARQREQEHVEEEAQKRQWTERKRAVEEERRAEEEREQSIRRAAEASGMLPAGMHQTLKAGMMSFQGKM